MRTEHETAVDPAPGSSAEFFASLLCARAERYFPELSGGPVECRLLRRDVREVSILYRFTLESGAGSRDVLVKVPLAAAEPARPLLPSAPPLRPRLAVALPPEERFLREFDSLAAIHDHFDALGDPRFGAVRVLELVPGHCAFAMEAVQGTSLRRLLYASYRRRAPAEAARLEEAFRNTGAWLRAYHALVPREPVEPRHTWRADYVRFVGELAEFLGARLGDPPFFQQVAAALTAAARDVLPEALPLGLGHGDFALRNVLVGARSRVTVLDTLARYRTPVYEDIGYFLVSLRHNWPQVFSLGSAFPTARLEGCERAFLSGYFGGEPVPHAAVRLYELQALLDRWAEVASRSPRTPGWRANVKRSVRLAFLSRCLRRRIAEEIPDAIGRGGARGSCAPAGQ